MHDASFITQLLNSLSALLGFPVSLELLFIVLALMSGAGFFAIFLQKRGAGLSNVRQTKRIARGLLLSAIDQRSTMDIELSAEGILSHVLSGPCSSIENDKVAVEAVGLKRGLQAWIGEPVDVSFRLTHKGTSSYYHFTSRVIGMQDDPSSVSVLLALPDQVLPMQKRSFVRITPQSSHLLGIGLWPHDPAQPLPMTYAKLGSAVLSYRPGQVAQCTLLNLSAGGMRMEVPKDLLPLLPAELTLESQLLCLLLLRSPVSDQSLPFWLACAVVSLTDNPEEDAPDLIIGLKFKAWALSEAGSQDIVWFPTGRSGEVTPLASWVLRHQLEQHKWQT
jgi:c-di-GMP-binding flagellar brake protein YcgR